MKVTIKYTILFLLIFKELFLFGQDSLKRTFQFSDKFFSVGAVKKIKIHYCFDCDWFNESEKSIDSVFVFLKENPKIIVEVASYTDSRGSDDYNLKLSQRRAENLKIILQEKGINANRIIAKGYGEARLLFSEQEIEKFLTEEEKTKAREENERTEIQIIDIPN